MEAFDSFGVTRRNTVMKIHRFIGAYPLVAGEHVIRDAEFLRLAHTVLRLAPGERVALCDGSGTEAIAVLKTVDRRAATVAIESVEKREADVDRDVTLYCAVLKRDHFEWVVQKATEVGVATIVPFVTERTIKTGLKLERLTQIAREAAEQSGRAVLPKIEAPHAFDEALQRFEIHDQVFCLELSSSETIDSVLPRNVAVMVGPEGGWTDGELAKFRTCSKVKIASLSPLVLRAETAAIVAAYAAISAAEIQRS